MEILVTGGAGYIGSHTVVALLEAGYEPVVADNLCNASEKVFARIEAITGKRVPFCRVDLRDRARLVDLFRRHRFGACIHFAGLKSVPESTRKPLLYYDNNLVGSLVLFGVMEEFGCKNIIFSSSATVYGTPRSVPVSEDCPKGETTNPYGETKAEAERILSDLQAADPAWNVVLLRYFNPIGAHASGLIGEQPSGVPNNLMPYLTQVAIGKREKLRIYGNDYRTHDGTGVRDYIHVCDLAEGHVKALGALERGCGRAVYNLGTGVGYSVLDVVKAFERVTGVRIPYSIEGRRPGDIDACYADPSKAKRELGWEAKYDLDRMCADAWRWQTRNPDGYDS